MQSPLIIAEYETEPRILASADDWAGMVIKFLAADTTIPMAIALDHGEDAATIHHARRPRRFHPCDD